MATLKAGAAQTNVTPPLGAYLAGSLKARHATEVHDELHAKALVLDDGATQLAFVICDVICIPREVCDAAKALIAERAGIPGERVLIAGTHTHSAPAMKPGFETVPIKATSTSSRPALPMPFSWRWDGRSQQDSVTVSEKSRAVCSIGGFA